MSHRSHARFLAPLALFAALATIYVVVHSGLKDSGAAVTAPAGLASTSTTAKTKRTTAKKTKAAKTYTVKSGDVLGAISERTGVTVDDLLRFNRLDQAQPLRLGQKLKLAP